MFEMACAKSWMVKYIRELFRMRPYEPRRTTWSYAVRSDRVAIMAAHAWCRLRYSPSGPLTTYAGKTDSGGLFHLHRTALKEKVSRAREGCTFLLITGAKDLEPNGVTRSALVAPLIGSAGNYRVLYLGSQPHREPYAMSDLDYLIVLALRLGAVLQSY